MVSDNESEFTNSKASLNQFNSSGRISSQKFLIIFQNFKFLTYFKKLKNGNIAGIFLI